VLEGRSVVQEQRGEDNLPRLMMTLVTLIVLPVVLGPYTRSGSSRGPAYVTNVSSTTAFFCLQVSGADRMQAWRPGTPRSLLM